jgi:hypothetical protein
MADNTTNTGTAATTTLADATTTAAAAAVATPGAANADTTAGDSAPAANAGTPAGAAAAATTEATPETPASVVPVVPETYDLKLPADSKADPAIVERTAAIARELGLSNEAGQKLLETVHAEVVAREAAIAEAAKPGGTAWKENVDRLAAVALADPEVGGSPEKLAANVELGKAVLTKFFPAEVKDFLNETGLGSDPRVLRGLVKIAKSMGEGSLVLGGTDDGGANTEEAALARMYPSMVKKT